MLVVKIRSDPGLDLPTHRQSDLAAPDRPQAFPILALENHRIVPPASNHPFLHHPASGPPPPERRTRQGPQTPRNKTTGDNMTSKKLSEPTAQTKPFRWNLSPAFNACLSPEPIP